MDPAVETWLREPVVCVTCGTAHPRAAYLFITRPTKQHLVCVTCRTAFYARSVEVIPPEATCAACGLPRPAPAFLDRKEGIVEPCYPCRNHARRAARDAARAKVRPSRRRRRPSLGVHPHYWSKHS